MISEAQLQSLDFEFNEILEMWEFEEISMCIDGQSYSVLLNDFELYGIRDVRDLRKLIELVYGS
jgi:hypothetical protein